VVFTQGSRCGSAIKWWNEKINENNRSWVRSPARATLFFKICYLYNPTGISDKLCCTTLSDVVQQKIGLILFVIIVG
jgi:hypothetical protein